MRTVPIWEKANLTLEEAAAYYGIGINKLRSLTDTDHCPYVHQAQGIREVSGKSVFRVTVVESGALMWYNDPVRAPDVKERSQWPKGEKTGKDGY